MTPPTPSASADECWSRAIDDLEERLRRQRDCLEGRVGPPPTDWRAPAIPLPEHLRLRFELAATQSAILEQSALEALHEAQANAVAGSPYR